MYLQLLMFSIMRTINQSIKSKVRTQIFIYFTTMQQSSQLYCEASINKVSLILLVLENNLKTNPVICTHGNIYVNVV